MRIEVARLGNILYAYCPRVYRPLYALYKAMADKAERRLLRSILRPGMTAIDVGANIGVYSQFLARLVQPDGLVYAFEPEPRNFSLLERTATRSPSILAINAAVGEHTGSLRLHISEDLNVDHHTYDAGDGRPTREVAVVKLDEFFDRGRRIDFLKFDIQGFELHALKGARRLLMENRDIKLLFEYWPYGLKRAGTEPQCLLDFLKDLGFTLTLKSDCGPKGITGIGDGINDYANIYASRDVN